MELKKKRITLITDVNFLTVVLNTKMTDFMMSFYTLEFKYIPKKTNKFDEMSLMGPT